MLIVTIFWWENGIRPVNSQNKTPVIFVVNNGEGVKEIASNLKKQGLIRDAVVFFILATKVEGIDKQIQAGDFRLNPSMSAQDIASSLTHGTLDIWVTIPEGLRSDEIANLLKNKMPNYETSWQTALEQNEGYLFPDTYLFPRGADINQIITILKDNFQNKYDSVVNTKTTNLTEGQTIVLASIIEREAKFAEDRPLAASVFINRLNIGMALGSDPTIQYALGYQDDTKTWWKKDLTIDDLAIKSPYNTRLNAGLPPGPISNPGLEAIKAALDPAKTDYLYFFADGKGQLHFATTLQGHQANIQKYGN